jgi:type IV secretory pathway TraG/TraD family ATPase VirD4
VTVWQSKAQLDQIYGRDADNVLTNHRTKLVYPSGLSDMATIEYVNVSVFCSASRLLQVRKRRVDRRIRSAWTAARAKWWRLAQTRRTSTSTA